MRRECIFEVLRTITLFFIVLYHFCTHVIGSQTVLHLNLSQQLSNLLYTDALLAVYSTCVNFYVITFFITSLYICTAIIICIRIDFCRQKFRLDYLFSRIDKHSYIFPNESNYFLSCVH